MRLLALFATSLLWLASGCVCAPGRVSCGGTCTDIQTDTSNCGVCGNTCLRGQLCEDGTCTSAFPVRGPCTSDRQCDDGNFCDGRERCVGGACRSEGDVVCDDGAACTRDSCDRAKGACVSVPDDSRCPTGQICTGQGASGCVPAQ